MQAFVDFILVDGPQLSFANLVSFFAFTIILGSIAVIGQALMHPTIHR